MSVSRRNALRVPARLLIDSHVHSGPPQIGISLNIGPDGIFLYRQPKIFAPSVQLEFKLPGQQESIWAKGAVRFAEDVGGYVGTGIAFTAMANLHWDMIYDWVLAARLRSIRARMCTRRPRAAAASTLALA